LAAKNLYALSSRYIGCENYPCSNCNVISSAEFFATVAQVDENCRAMQFDPLTQEQFQELEGIIERAGRG
jgi:hypothetical protein